VQRFSPFRLLLFEFLFLRRTHLRVSRVHTCYIVIFIQGGINYSNITGSIMYLLIINIYFTKCIYNMFVSVCVCVCVSDFSKICHSRHIFMDDKIALFNASLFLRDYLSSSSQFPYPNSPLHVLPFSAGFRSLNFYSCTIRTSS